MLIENDQALYRGELHYWPTELWNVKLQMWEPYTGKVPKDATWGNVVTDAEAKGFMEPI